MNDSAKKTTLFRYIYPAVILLSLLIYLFSVIFSCSQYILPYSRFVDTGIRSFSEDWYTEDSSGNQESIPELSQWNKETDDTLVFFKTLPELTDSDCLFIEVNYTHIKVFVNDSCIYDYSAGRMPAPSGMTGHFMAQIPLDAGMSGQTVSVEVYQPYRMLPTGLNTVKLGTGSAYITDYLFSHIELIISLFFMLAAGLCLMAIYLWQKCVQKWDGYSMLRPLALLLLLSTVWIFTDSQLPQLFWENPVIVCIISFLSFMALPVPVFSFASKLCPDKYGVLTKMQFLLMLNIMVQGILFSLNVFSFVEMLPVTHTLIILSVIVLLVLLLKQYWKKLSPYARPMLTALIVLILSALLSLVQFYISPQTDNSRFLRYGFMIFIGIMVYICIRAMLTFFHDYTENQILKDLAYKDFLTGVENRLAFENLMDEMRGFDTPVPVSLCSFDLNNLKVTNDTFGHKAGDIILKAAALCITDTFQGLGRIFRIGGDEFVVVIQSPGMDLPGLIEKLKDRIRRENETCEFSFSVSSGYASSAAACGNALNLLLRKSDMEMYKDKAVYREQVRRRIGED